MVAYYRAKTKQTSYKKNLVYKPGSIGLVEFARDEDIAIVAHEMALEPTDLTDIYDAQEIPRLEVEKGVVILFIRAPLPLDNNEALETQLYMVLWGKDKLYVITSGKATHFNSMIVSPAIKKMAVPAFLVEFLLYISRGYTQNINEIAKRVDHYRKNARVLTNIHIEDLIDLEVILNEYVSALAPMQHLCMTLFSRRKSEWQPSMMDLVEDLMNSMAQSADVSLVNLKKIHSLRDSFQIIFTNRLNHTLKILTAVTIILTIPTMIASLFGMNVNLPWSNHPQAFVLVIFLALVTSGIAAVLFRLNRWM